MQYALAASVFDGRLTLGSFTDEMVMRPAVRALMKKVRTEYKPDPGAEIVARANGVDHRAAAMIVRGDPANPLSKQELLQKCYQCLDGVLDHSRIDRLVEAVERLEQLGDVRELTALLQVTPH